MPDLIGPHFRAGRFPDNLMQMRQDWRCGSGFG
jgi:hypothetical protein